MKRLWLACTAGLLALAVILAAELPPWRSDLPGPGVQTAWMGDRVPVNLATQADLTALPGIGEKRARAIVESRSQQGTFESARDLARVDGISENMALELAPYLDFRMEPEQEGRCDDGTQG